MLEVSRYIHRNPVESSKPVVKELELYQCTSYPAYRNKALSPEWLYRDSVFDELGSGRPSASYKRFVESGNDEDTEKFYTKNHWLAIRGSKKFAEKAHLYSNSKKPGVRREHKEVASGDILRVVASRYGCTKKDLLTAKRGSGVDNTARACLLYTSPSPRD